MFNRSRQCHLEYLEDRQMMAASPLYFANGASLLRPTASYTPVAEAVSYPAPSDTAGPRATEVFDPTRLSDPEYDKWLGLPMLDSNPGAPITIHLDFTGHSMNSFTNHKGTFPKNGLPIVTPVYSTDIDPSSFSAKELQEIRQIWARVAEDYAPFNVNVTTHYYGEYTDGKALKVAIGGHPNDWYVDWQTSSETPPGTSSVGSFTDPKKPNVVFVFSTDLWFASSSIEKDNDGRSIDLIASVANTASHEAGHAFGLEHLSKYVNGKRVDVYDGGTAEWTPIMGDNLASDRTTWAYGPTDAGPNVYQHDVQILSSVLGLRPDDHANSRYGATQLTTSNAAATPLTGKGIIEWQADVDMFKFTSNGGPLEVKVNAAPYGPNMWVRAQLWNETGFVAAGVNAVSNYEAIVSANVPKGTYYVVVQGAGGFGALGQYSVSVKTNLSNSSAVTGLGGTVVGPVGPTTPTKGTMEVSKGTTTSTKTASKSINGDGNSNEPVASTASTTSSLAVSGKTKNKQASLPLELGLALKDAAFAIF